MKATGIQKIMPRGVEGFLLFVLAVFFAYHSQAADPPPEFTAAAMKRRAEIPTGGDFKPDPKSPVFVAVGHGGRILLSCDDGQSWQQVFWGYPGSDHGPWATKAIAYTNGVFVVPVGWGAATAWLASEDGQNWRHLTSGQTKLQGVKEANGDPTVMPATWGIAGGQGVFVTGGYMQMAATPDFGKTITTFSLYDFKKDPRARKLVIHHVGPIYCGDASGRFLALGNDRSRSPGVQPLDSDSTAVRNNKHQQPPKKAAGEQKPQLEAKNKSQQGREAQAAVGPVFGNLFASDDLGKTWKWLEPQWLNSKCDGYSGIASNGSLVIIADKSGANTFVSQDAGDSWSGPFPTGLERATLSLVSNEFWLVSRQAARASADGKIWRDLPRGIPTGRLIASPHGTLISIDRQRFNILRSTDGGKSWTEVYAFQPVTEHVHGAQGLRDIAFGYVSSQPVGTAANP
ncbi:MAG: glycoside hydrolase [bacterium]|nr:glycoside hydrolase [bacterium]